MPIFQHQPSSAVYTPDQAFTNLFRLIDGFDNYSREVNNNQQAVGAPAGSNSAVQAGGHGNKVASRVPSSPTRAFSPRFDVRETDTAYELHGELPGVARKDVTIEFSDPTTLVVSGRIERSYETDQAPTTAGTVTPASASPSLKATVEDEPVDDEGVLVDEHAKETAAKEAAAAPKEAAAKETTVAPAATTTTTAAATTTKPVRYWYRERSVGQFRRVFEFPIAINEDAVKASLDNGVLSVTVPKAAKRQTKRIAVN